MATSSGSTASKISDLVVDPRAPDVYWATFSNPGAADLDRIWVACDVGVYETRVGTGSWALLGTGLPNALAEDLLFHESAPLLRVGTRSRGVRKIQPG